MELEKDVIESESSTDIDSQEPTPNSSEGNNSLKGEENFKELLKKKDKAISDLRAKLESYQSEKEERIEELESKKRLSASEQDELESLQDQVAAIKRDKRSKPWLEVNKEISKNVTKDGIDSLDLAYAEEFVEELAEKEGKDVDEFMPEIKKYMRRVDPEANMRLLTRAKKAYKMMKHEETLSKREKELLEKERRFSEAGGSKQPKAPSRDELLGWKNSKDPDLALTQLLKGVNAVQSEQTSR